MSTVKSWCAARIPLAALFAASVIPFAHAGSGTTSIGWVLADQPNATSAYTAKPAYSYSSFGGGVTVTPVSTGNYLVSFAGFTSPTFINDQISAYGSTGYCIDNNGGGTMSGPVWEVSCFDANGNPANTEFTLLVQRRTGTQGNSGHALSFLFADAPTTSQYVPQFNVQYNSTGGTNSVTRNGTGDYTALFPGLTKVGGYAEATAFYSTFRQYPRCAVLAWNSTSSGTSAHVNCFNNGALVDNKFYLAYSIGLPLGHFAIGGTNGIYAWATKPESAKPYRTVSTYTYNGFATGPLTAQKTGTGTYSVAIPGTISYSKSIALATAVGSSSNYCNIAGWTQQTINVACYAQGGVSTDSEFAVTLQTAP